MLQVRKRLTSLIMAIVIIILSAMPVYATDDAAAVSSGDAPAETVSPTDSDLQTPAEPPSEPEPPSADMRDVTAAQVMNEINLGWNLGEALESWSSDAGYDAYYNSNAYQLILRYDDSKGTRSTSMTKTFDKNNTCTISWMTGLIDSDSEVALGAIGFEIWNLAIEEPTTVTINVTKAKLTRRNKQVIEFDELLGEHTVTISKYGTIAVLTEDWPDNLRRTYGITDGTYEVTVELVDFPQKEYGKPEYFETLWNNPLTTYDMINKVKEAGFNAVRIPVTFFNHIPSNSDVIDTGWLDRIQEVVDYVVHQDMYCILSFYHDGSTTGWLRVASGSDVSVSDSDISKYTSIWTQLSERFKNYNEKLIFQGYNELTDKDNTWGYPGQGDIDWVNDLAQTFVDTVRATGGNNSNRCLIVMPYAGSHDQQIIDGFRLPNDTARDRLIVAVNAYAPALFAYSIDLGEESEGEDQAVSATDVAQWGTPEDEAELDALFRKLQTRFINQSIPVMITEFCSADKGNTEDRVRHAAYYTKKSDETGIPCFWWDDGNLLLRRSLTWSYEEIVNAMVDSTSTHISKLSIDFPAENYYTGEPLYPSPRVYYYGGDVLSGTDLVSGSDVVLMEGTDYELLYVNNTEIGTADVTVTGLGRYSGFVKRNFEITEKPREVSILTNLAQSDPDLPLVIMLSFPIVLGLAGLVVFQTMRRREREAVEATISASLEGAAVADTSDIDDPSYSDFSSLHIKPEREPREKKARKKQAAEELAAQFDEEPEMPTGKGSKSKPKKSKKKSAPDMSEFIDDEF